MTAEERRRCLWLERVEGVRVPGRFVASSGPRGVAGAGVMGGLRGSLFCLTAADGFADSFRDGVFDPDDGGGFGGGLGDGDGESVDEGVKLRDCGSGLAAEARRGCGGSFGVAGSAAAGGGGVLLFEFTHAGDGLLVSAREEGRELAEFRAGLRPRHCRLLRSAVRMSPRPSCAQTLAAASGMTG